MNACIFIKSIQIDIWPSSEVGGGSAKLFVSSRSPFLLKEIKPNFSTFWKIVTVLKKIDSSKNCDISKKFDILKILDIFEFFCQFRKFLTISKNVDNFKICNSSKNFDFSKNCDCSKVLIVRKIMTVRKLWHIDFFIFKSFFHPLGVSREAYYSAKLFVSSRA